MTTLTELTDKLAEVFQIDRPDLDFGIYRILNSRSQEIGDYLQNQLPQAVKAAFGAQNDARAAQWQNELAEAVKAAAALGIDPAASPKVQTLQQQIQTASQSGNAQENAVYNHLYTFFSRYYDEGDFISQRRYKGDTYAVPYAGEEVLLHWANKDQYYTKSGENFSNYRFTLADGRQVFFRLVEADTAKDNRKDNDSKRVFVLAQAQNAREDENGDIIQAEILPIAQTDHEQTLEIRFEYKAVAKSDKTNYTQQALDAVFADDTVQQRWGAHLGERAPTDKNPNRTLLEKHLSDYTQKNSADYFIHKDLGVFLRRELDFYIKNEVMQLDDIQEADFARLQSQLALIQTLRTIATDIIAFLAQLENFQKKLWLKKKFVAAASYLITLNHIPEKLLDTVFANAKQLEQWQNLFAFNELPPRNLKSLAKSNPYLVVDTALYPPEFQADLLSELSLTLSDGLDNATDGLLIHSDNFQALNLLQTRYREQVKCIYIDPPYNTGEDGFPYKDNYQSSSWLSMFECRLKLSKSYLNLSGLLACHMDEHEHFSLEWLIKQSFQTGDMGKLIWDKRNPKGDAKGLAAQHEYVHFATRNSDTLNQEDAFVRNKANAEAMLKKAESLISKFGVSEHARSEYKEWIRDNNELSGGEKAYNQIDENGDIYRPVSMSWPNKKQAPAEYFIPLTHPITGKPCPVPARGWRNPPQTMASLLEKNLILFGTDETTIPNRKYLLKENLTENVSSLYYMGSSDDELLKNMDFSFDNPKPIRAAKYFLSIISRPTNSLILDYFAGSGTTAHAVINLNREDGGKRKYILVEQGEYFDTVLKPRVQKVVYAENWKDGKPVPCGKPSENRTEANPFNGVSQIVKVLKLESYEDTLNNLVLQRKGQVDFLSDEVKQDYLLHYMLEADSRDSLLSSDDFRQPFDYQLNISTGSAGAFAAQTIDLVETFNYLIGLRVCTVDDQAAARGFVFVEGSLPNNEKCLVLWRDCERWGYEQLPELLDKRAVNPRDNEYDVVYINGDHNIATVWASDETDGGWGKGLKLRPIEPEFLRLMFEE